MSLTLHADDLGLHPAVDRAVFRAFEAGAIGGASLLVTGSTFREAAAQARALRLPVSLHLSIVDTGSISPTGDIPSLVGRDGRFPPTALSVMQRALLGRLRPDELRVEIGRQMDAFASAGLIGTGGLHIDGHQHLHLLPSVFSALLECGQAYSLTAFRLPRRSQAERTEHSQRAVGFAIAEYLGRRAVVKAARAGVWPISCWGVLYAGRLSVELARAVLASVPVRAHGQLICHPGDDDRALQLAHPWGYAWEAELRAVLALAEQLADGASADERLGDRGRA